MREAVEFQYPLLNEPSNPGRPLSNAQSAAPQTYTEILPWELSEAACELINALDNTERLYYKPPCHAQREGRFEAEVDIRGRVVRVMDTVNAALKQQGSAVRCHGGGEGRSMSFADLAMRLDNMEEDNNLKDLSSRVLGIVLVRKNLGLKQGESLEEALKDPQRGGPIKAAVQEVRCDEKPWHLIFLCKLPLRFTNAVRKGSPCSCHKVLPDKQTQIYGMALFLRDGYMWCRHMGWQWWPRPRSLR